MAFELNKEDIPRYFEKIDARLKAVGRHGSIMMTGGASLAFVFGARDSTYDIDAIFEPKQDMQRIIEEIAEEEDLPPDWLNDGVKGFITPNVKSSVVLELSNLTVSSVAPECLLALKLTSARALSKDMDDSVFLMGKLNIQTVDELFDLIEKYSYKDRQTVISKYFTLEAFEKYKDSL